MANTSTKTFLYLLRGGISERSTLSPEQMQKMVEKYMNYMQGLRDKDALIAGEPSKKPVKFFPAIAAAESPMGPFTESKEAVGGYFLIDLGSEKNLASIFSSRSREQREGIGVPYPGRNRSASLCGAKL